METKASARFVHISARKARQAVDLIRGKSLGEAISTLRFMPKRAARIVEKVVHSAAANAQNNDNQNLASLYVAKAFVDEGPVMKRVIPRSRGMANRIQKRTSHITVVLSERD